MPICIFERPEIVTVDDDGESWRRPRLEVIFERQSPWRDKTGRMRVRDLYVLLVDGKLDTLGPRRFVLAEAQAYAERDTSGQPIPWKTGATALERRRELQWKRRDNIRRDPRRRNRRQRKASRRWWRRSGISKLMDSLYRHVFRDALYPKLLFRTEAMRDVQLTSPKTP